MEFKDLKLKLDKVPVVYLNGASDFTKWHLALRRVAVGLDMQDALLYTVPHDKLASYKKRAEEVAKIKKEEKQDIDKNPENVQKTSRSYSASMKSLEGGELTAEVVHLYDSLGVTQEMASFFAATTKFVDVRTEREEAERSTVYRQELWTWMETSLEKGTFKWLSKSIKPVYDVHALYTKVCSLANRATWISHALEFKKIFTITPGDDIFAYHAQVTEQINLVRSQGSSLGLASTIPPWMEQALLLIAAWQNPQYHRIALEYTLEGGTVSVETLVRELNEVKLLTSHLNQSGVRRSGRREEVSAKMSVSDTPSKKAYCFGYQKGECTRGDSCPFVHEMERQDTELREETHKKQERRQSRRTLRTNPREDLVRRRRTKGVQTPLAGAEPVDNEGKFIILIQQGQQLIESVLPLWIQLSLVS